MSNFAWIITIVLLLTLLSSLTLLLITVKYYWGERGTPPLTGELKQCRKEEELRLRARQIEHSKSNPRKTRSGNFWDNFIFIVLPKFLGGIVLLAKKNIKS